MYFSNIEEVVEFPDCNKAKNLSYSLKMMIAQEIEQEKLRRLENVLLKNNLRDDVPVSVSEEPLLDMPMEIVERKLNIKNVCSILV